MCSITSADASCLAGEHYIFLKPHPHSPKSHMTSLLLWVSIHACGHEGKSLKRRWITEYSVLATVQLFRDHFPSSDWGSLCKQALGFLPLLLMDQLWRWCLNYVFNVFPTFSCSLYPPLILASPFLQPPSVLFSSMRCTPAALCMASST